MAFRNPEHHASGYAAPAPAAHAPAKSSKGRTAKLQKQMIMWLVIAILFIAAIGTAAYYVKRYNDTQKQLKKVSATSQQTVQSQNQQLINSVGRLTVLPNNETPTIATVTDITKLKDQVFFVNAQNGDKVLIYTQAKKAFLYRPSTNKLINIAPVNLGNGANSPTTGTSATTNSTTKKP
jgi:hypothetical protein